MSIPVWKFPHTLYPGKIPFICTSMDSSVHHTGSLSFNLSLSAANQSKVPCNYGEKNAVNYLHENPVKSPSVSALSVQPVCTLCITTVIVPVCALSIQPICTSCITSVIAPVCASSIQPVHTSCITSVVAPVHALPVLSVHPSDDERQEFLHGFPSTKYGEKNLSKIMVKFPHNVTLALHQAKFLEETPDTINRVIYPVNFTSTQIQVKFMVTNLKTMS